MKKVSRGEIKTFLSLYVNGYPFEALETIHPSPCISFSEIQKEDQEHFVAARFADSLGFDRIERFDNQAVKTFPLVYTDPLTETLKREMEEAAALTSSVDRLRQMFDKGLLEGIERETLQSIMLLQSLKPIKPGMLDQLLKTLPEKRYLKLYRQLRWLSNVYQVNRRQSLLLSSFEHPKHSLYPISYPLTDQIKSDFEKSLNDLGKRTPLFLLYSYRLNWSEILESLGDKEAIFAFPHSHAFFHSLENDALCAALLSSHHHILFLNEDFASQAQHQHEISPNELHPIVCAPRKSGLYKHANRICNLLQKIYSEKDSQSITDLYFLNRLIIESELHEKFGPDSALQIQLIEDDRSWYAANKNRPSRQITKLFDNLKYVDYKLDKLEPLYPKRPRIDQPKLKIAHITPQIVDGNHSPSLLLSSMVKLGNKDRFEYFVASTERVISRPNEYPRKEYSTSSSSQRASRLLKSFSREGVTNYIVNSNDLDIDATAKRVSMWLSMHEIDIAVFHSFDVVNLSIARLCDVPLKVGFSHSDLPDHPGMDLLIACEQESIAKSDTFNSWGMKTHAQEYVIDTRQCWDAFPYPMSFFELEEGSKILTTVSNHLEKRISPEMTEAIIRILQQNPEVYYMPIGGLHDKAAFINRFKRFGVAPQVKPMGEQSNPSQLMRSMSIYLNEFPFGGCASILDAMACGLPVVSMYDKNGPPQGRHAATFLGKEAVIHSKKIDDYVKICADLINDRNFYEKSSAHSLECYENRTKPQEYIRDLETIILNTYLEKETPIKEFVKT